ALSGAPAGGLTDPNRLLAQVGPMLAGLPDDRGAAATFALANQYVRAGQWPLARELFLLTASRYPAHPLAIDACRWLIRHSASSEARRRHELNQTWMSTQDTLQLSQIPGLKEAGLPEGVRVQQVGLVGSLQETRQWY